MKPRRTPTSTRVFRLPGGNEDSDLWVRDVVVDGQAVIESVWSLTDAERGAIADGANIVLAVWGSGTPPVELYITEEQPGRAL